MAQSVVLSEDEVWRLKQFHIAHFPNQKLPSIEHSTTTQPTTNLNVEVETEDNLGTYHDGVKRTLTDDQIAMLRDSEIRRILQERRKAAEEILLKQEGRQEEDHNDARQLGQRTWTKHFDEASEVVNTLSYDDQSGDTVQVQTGSKKFLWPTLG